MYHSHKYFIFIIILMMLNLNAQENKFVPPDSLINRTLKELYFAYYNSESNLKKDSIIANTYFIKALEKNDTINIVTGYCFLMSGTEDIKRKEEYLDKAINMTKNNFSYNFPCLLYSLKAGIYDEKKDFKTALDYYILSHDSALRVGNHDIVNMMRYNIGVTKLNIGMYADALSYAIESWNDLKNKAVSDLYLNSLFLISSAYTNNAKIDSASFFNNLGIKKSLEFKSETQLSRFILLEGVNSFKKLEFQGSIDSLNKSLPQLIRDNDTENISIAYYFLGKSYLELDNPKKSIFYFTKMDSIFSNFEILVPYCRDGYKEMIKHYKSKNDTENQLFYTSKLVQIDSVLDNNYQYLISNIYENHEKPRLIADKQTLINILEKEKSSFGNYLIFLFFMILIVGAGFLISIYKRKKDYKKFTKIIKDLEKNRINTNKSISNSLSNIDENVIKDILSKLDKFEKEDGYLNKKVTLPILSKKLGTNAKYLSKIINTHKQKNFSNYINDLRVEYAINRLYSDQQFRKYSIEAIADDSGFKSSRSFFGVFQKKTGISPSYFIKQLE